LKGAKIFPQHSFVDQFEAIKVLEDDMKTLGFQPYNSKYCTYCLAAE
jgi:hypothetical protein